MAAYKNVILCKVNVDELAAKLASAYTLRLSPLSKAYGTARFANLQVQNHQGARAEAVFVLRNGFDLEKTAFDSRPNETNAGAPAALPFDHADSELDKCITLIDAGIAQIVASAPEYAGKNYMPIVFSRQVNAGSAESFDDVTTATVRSYRMKLDSHKYAEKYPVAALRGQPRTLVYINGESMPLETQQPSQLLVRGSRVASLEFSVSVTVSGDRVMPNVLLREIRATKPAASATDVARAEPIDEDILA